MTNGEERERSTQFKIIADSTLRHANQLVMSTDVECVSGGGMGMLANLITYDEKKTAETFIIAGTNDLRLDDDITFVSTVERSVKKLGEMSEDTVIHMIIPAPLSESYEDIDRHTYMTQLFQNEINDRENSTLTVQEDINRTNDKHPTKTGTYHILRQLQQMNDQLFWTDDLTE